MKRDLLGSLAVLVVLAAPASAGAATTVGQVAPSAMAAAVCPGSTLVAATQVAAGTPSYTVPDDGVITSWSSQGGPGPSRLKFKVVRDQLASYRIVGADPIERTVPASALATFDVRIPVAPGDQIALWVPVGAYCLFAGQDGDIGNYQTGIPEPAIGDDVALVAGEQFRPNLSAQLEPDSDADGYGDETQDACPTDVSTQLECDPPETKITKHPANKSKKPNAKFKFSSDEPGATFECKLKGNGLDQEVKQFNDCDSPRKYKGLDQGKFKFQVRAVDDGGNVDSSPAKDKFKVVD